MNQNDLKDIFKKVGLPRGAIWERFAHDIIDVLNDEEQIIAAIDAFYNGKNGIMIATDSRLIIACKGWIAGVTMVDFIFSQVTNIHYKSGLLKHKTTVSTIGDSVSTTSTDKAASLKFTETVKNLLSANSVKR